MKLKIVMFILYIPFIAMSSTYTQHEWTRLADGRSNGNDTPVAYLEANNKQFITHDRDLCGGGDPGIIPVELINFKGQLYMAKSQNTEAHNPNSESGIMLTWQTADEIRFNSFEVERSVDGQLWSKLMKQPAKGSASDYKILDLEPILGNNYYRLKMLDKDGTVSYSKSIVLEWNIRTGKEWSVFPAIVKTKVYISSCENLSDNDFVRVLDVSGKIIMQTTVSYVHDGLTVGFLPNGTYVLEVRDKQKSDRKSLDLFKDKKNRF